MKSFVYSFLFFVFTQLDAQSHRCLAIVAADSQFVKHGALFKFLWGKNYVPLHGSLAVPGIADALNLAHDHPQLVVISNDTSVGKYQQEFGGKLCFIEDRNPKGRSISTEKMCKIKDSIANVFIATMTYLKCRLMDIVLGDWDRLFSFHIYSLLSILRVAVLSQDCQ